MQDGALFQHSIFNLSQIVKLEYHVCENCLRGCEQKSEKFQGHRTRLLSLEPHVHWPFCCCIFPSS